MDLNSFQTIDNYKNQLSSNSTEILAKYINIITEYFVNFSETIRIKNKEKYTYLLNKGLLTLNHVFKILLLYTKNLQMTYEHSQKSVYYYIEFINQIDDNNINHVMQLNSNNATLFVYKKTIFEINNDIKRDVDINSEETRIVFKNINSFIEIYQYIINIIVHSADLELEPALENKATLLQKIYNNMSTITQDLINISLNCSEEIYNDHLAGVMTFAKQLRRKNIQSLIYIELFIKKINNKVAIAINKEKMIHTILQDVDKIDELIPNKYINWLFRALSISK
jgi:hypothetical protein